MTNELPYNDPSKVITDTDYLKTVFEDMNKRFSEELEHSQGRSQYQIEKFVASGEFTLSSSFKHVLKNAQIMRGELFRVIKEGIEYQREFELKWSEDSDKTKPVSWPTKDGGTKFHWHDLDSYEYKNYLNALAISIKDKVQQLAFFDQILDQLIEKNGGPITREQYDAEEPIYWQRRMVKQIQTDLLSGATGVSGGNLVAAMDAAAPTILPDSNNQISLPNMDLLIRGSKEYNPNAFLSFAQQLAIDSAVEISTLGTQKLENKTNITKIDVQQSNDKLDSLGISKTKI